MINSTKNESNWRTRFFVELKQKYRYKNSVYFRKIIFNKT